MSTVLRPEPLSGEYRIPQAGSGIRTVHRLLPQGYGFGLPVVYLVWLCVVAAIYPVCRRYAAIKARSQTGWLSYL